MLSFRNYDIKDLDERTQLLQLKQSKDAAVIDRVFGKGRSKIPKHELSSKRHAFAFCVALQMVFDAYNLSDSEDLFAVLPQDPEVTSGPVNCLSLNNTPAEMKKLGQTKMHFSLLWPRKGLVEVSNYVRVDQVGDLMYGAQVNSVVNADMPDLKIETIATLDEADFAIATLEVAREYRRVGGMVESPGDYEFLLAGLN